MSFQWSLTDASPGEGFVRIARQQIGKAIRAAEKVDQSPEKRVHEARRRCKKLRALLRLVRPDFPNYAAENAFVRDASRMLAGARDERVARQTYDELMRAAGRPVPERADEPTDAEAEATALAAFAAQMREMQARTADWPASRIALGTLAAGLRDNYRRARQTRRVAELRRSDELFHEWRKYTKYHWNQLRLLEASASDVLPSAQESAGELAETLGQHHDLAVLGQILETVPEEIAPDVDVEFVKEAIVRRQTELEERIAALGRQLFAEKPKALKARFAAYLRGWQKAAA